MSQEELKIEDQPGKVAAADPNADMRLTYPAYAKINLSLEILGKRPDRFHNLISVMQTVSLADELHLCPAPDLEFDCNLPELVNQNNLVWRAACRMHDLLPEDSKKGVSIYLEKSIPVAAGLGGGSSDAATTLIALNEFWGLELTEEHLVQEAAKLGSDVPFFIRGGTALAEGRGEILTPLPSLRRSYVVLLYPEIELPANKTAALYRSLERNDFSTGFITQQLVTEIKAGRRPSQAFFHNTFELVAYQRFPEMDSYRAAMVTAGADYVRVSGSGPTLYTFLEDKDEGREITQKLADAGYLVYLAETVASRLE